MAVVQYSALLTQLRGKLGGSQFNKSHAGYSLQRKATQPRRDSRAQSLQRQLMQLVQRTWKEESTVRQAQAAQAAISNPVSDRFGQQVVLSGYQHYVKTMLWRLRSNNVIASEIITTPVASAELVLVVNSLSVVYDSESNNYVFTIDASRSTNGTPTGTVSLTRAFLYLTKVDANNRPISPARAVFYRYVSYNDLALTSPSQLFVSGISYSPGDFVRLDVITRNTAAGANTGFNSQLVQLS